jgi:serine phosphatase RsbU (regulator of sigma subunit)/anti-sigma regulatory factor (Ser/Thr protein kinase)
MAAITRFLRRKPKAEEPHESTGARAPVESPAVDISPNDPLIAYFQAASGAVELDGLDLESPAKEALKAAGMKLVVPLISQGELIGLLNLGPRLSERDYSGDDRKLLDNLAAHAAPAVRVAQLVRQQEAEVRSRERIEQELRVAQLIQQQFLPKELPDLPRWQVAAYYQPARTVGGDFYDFIDLPDGLIGIVVGDVTDKGVPAALVMATTHSILRGDAPRLVSPSEVLKHANDRLYPEIPARMFVTCLYMVLNPETGHIRYANAGHNLPYVRSEHEVTEMHATGMPLGLMPDMTYEEMETVLEPGQSLLLHSDGLAEAHGPSDEMFGFPRLMGLVGNSQGGGRMIDRLLTELHSFTGPEWEQEDDITLVTLERSAGPGSMVAPSTNSTRTLAEFSLASEPGNERIAMERVAEAVKDLELASDVFDRLRTAVSEATMNAIEHGNHNRPELDVAVQVFASDEDIKVRITDHGGGRNIPDEVETPDIEAKLEGLQTPRGWGLFLIKNMCDDMEVSSDGDTHTIELSLKMKGNGHGS